MKLSLFVGHDIVKEFFISLNLYLNPCSGNRASRRICYGSRDALSSQQTHIYKLIATTVHPSRSVRPLPEQRQSRYQRDQQNRSAHQLQLTGAPSIP